MDIAKLIISQIFGEPLTLSLLILLLPFVSFLILFFFAPYFPGKGDKLATFFAGLTFLLSLLLFINGWNVESMLQQITWFEMMAGSKHLTFTASIDVNNLSIMMLLLVSFISFLVNLYSIEYMKGKRHYDRYFPYLALFTFSMIGIVLSDNLLITFMFWEMVGFSSYLLIGFWYEKESAMRAAKKAFLFNRIGDTGFILGLIAFYAVAGSLEISFLQEKAGQGAFGSQLLFWAGFGIFLGCVGKSAQFPLQAWLPDAMEGPTPASALIHAATMVAAGIYLLLKVHILLHTDVLNIIACVGALTAFLGAVPALFQTDIKKVLAFSTISQLGYMTMAVGVQAYDAALFHLITHGFFKACLFLAAGSIIHAMHEIKHELFLKGSYRDFDSQDMRLMGGFGKVMPVTYFSYVVSAAALVGLPFFSGFLSKDAILDGTLMWASHGERIYYIVPVLAFLTVFITAAYMARQIMMVFIGENRLVNFYPAAKELFSKLHDPSLLMKGPLIILSLLCFWFAFSPSPLGASHGWIFKLDEHLLTGIISTIVSIAGIAFAYFAFKNAPVSFKDHVEGEKADLKGVLKNNWNMDKAFYYMLVLPGFKTANWTWFIDNRIINGFIHFMAMFNVVFGHVIAWVDKVFVDGIVNWLAKLAGRLGRMYSGIQGGKIQGYFVFALFVAIILAIWIIIS